MEQVRGDWRARSDNMAVLCDIAKELKETFLTFQINHVLRLGLTFSIIIWPCSHLLLDSWYNMC